MSSRKRTTRNSLKNVRETKRPSQAQVSPVSSVVIDLTDGFGEIHRDPSIVNQIPDVFSPDVDYISLSGCESEPNCLGSECEEDNDSEIELSDQEAHIVNKDDLDQFMEYDFIDHQQPDPELDCDLEGFVVPDDEPVSVYGDSEDF